MCDWLFAADVTHSCARASLTQDQALMLTEKVDDQHHGTNKSQIGVVWFCQFKTNPYNSEFVHLHHGTGPGPGTII